MMSTRRYVLISAARNEEAYIERTILSVIAQTILPQKWVIVSDGSTDRTDEIVKRYESDHNFIRLVRKEPDRSRDFASKVFAIRAGMKLLENIEYDFIGILDTDVSFDPEYYERVLEKFEQKPKLGIGGGVIHDKHGGNYHRQFTSFLWSVNGAIQMFPRKCWEDISGYIPLKRGGVDMIAETMARMHGWDVRAFPEIKVLHHRPTGTEKNNIFLVEFNRGIMEYVNGYHPLFQAARFFYRLKQRPYLLGSIFRTTGYSWAFLSRQKQAVPDNVIKFMRWEQKQRMLARISHKQRQRDL